MQYLPLLAVPRAHLSHPMSCDVKENTRIPSANGLPYVKVKFAQPVACRSTRSPLGSVALAASVKVAPLAMVVPALEASSSSAPLLKTYTRAETWSLACPVISSVR